jgi:hypothetical protein
MVGLGTYAENGSNPVWNGPVSVDSLLSRPSKNLNEIRAAKAEIIMFERIARKDYRCWRCGGLIAKGELYYDNRRMGKPPSHLFRLEPRLEDFRSGGDTWKEGVRDALAWREAVDQWRNTAFREGPICDASRGRMAIPRSDRRQKPIFTETSA